MDIDLLSVLDDSSSYNVIKQKISEFIKTNTQKQVIQQVTTPSVRVDTTDVPSLSSQTKSIVIVVKLKS